MNNFRCLTSKKTKNGGTSPFKGVLSNPENAVSRNADAKGGERMRAVKWLPFVLSALLLVPALAAELKSGKAVGSKGAPPYNPQHVGGPFKGGTDCPV